jgi:hypothetical protein
MDENVPGPITRGLVRRGVDVLMVQDDLGEGEPDEVILARAGSLLRLVFTRDQDFLAIASDLQHRGIEFAGVIYAHQDALSIGECISDLEIVAKCSELDEWRNKVAYLPL